MNEEISKAETRAMMEDWFQTMTHLLSARESLRSIHWENFAELNIESVTEILELKISDTIYKLNLLRTDWL